MMQVSEVVGVKEGKLQLAEIFGFQQKGVVDGRAVGEFYATGHIPQCLDRLRAAGIIVPHDLFQNRRMAEGIQNLDIAADP